MKIFKNVLLLLIFILLISSVNAKEIKRYQAETYMKIVKQDYMQEYIDYSIIKINETEFILKYQIIDKNLFKEIKESKDNSVDLFYNKLNKYPKNKLADDIKNLKKDGIFPITTSTPNINIIGNVSPFLNNGELKIILPNGIKKTEDFTIHIGYGTLVLQFTNGESSIQDYLGFNYAFLQNITRFMAFPYLATINNATLNVTGLNGNYSIYHEFDYFADTEVDVDKWNRSSISNGGSDCSASITQNSDYLNLYSNCIGGEGVDSSSNHISANNTQTYTYLNLSQNTSIFLSFYHYSECNAPCGGGSASSSSRIYITNQSGSQIEIYQKGSSCSGGGDADSDLVYVKLIFNESNGNMTIFDLDNNPTTLSGNTQYNLSTLGGDKFITFYTAAYKNGQPNPCGAYSLNYVYVYDIGYNANETEYISYTNTNTLPANFTFNLGNINVYSNSSYLNESTTLDFSTELNTALNNGLCDCSGCYLSAGYCYVPLVFNSTYGGGLNVSSVEVNYAYDYNVTLINEINNSVFDLTNLSIARVYWDDNTTFYDFKAENNPSYAFQGGIGTKLRFEFAYYGTSTIMRYIDTSLINESYIRVCVNTDDITHYEQLMTSNTIRKALLKSIYSDCYVAGDNTRFAYENLQTLRAFTIDRPYELITDIRGVETSIAGIDGGVASEINLDTLEFAQTEYNIDIIQPTLSFMKSATLQNTIIITYLNRRLDGESLKITITNLNDSSVVYSSTGFANPNNATIYFDYSLLNYDNNTLFKIVALNNEGLDTEQETKRYFTTNLKVGILNPWFALIMTTFLALFGLTITLVRFVLGWFGLLIEATNIALLSLAITSWYITFFIGLHIIIFIFILIVLIKQNYKTMVS